MKVRLWILFHLKQNIDRTIDVGRCGILFNVSAILAITFMSDKCLNKMAGKLFAYTTRSGPVVYREIGMMYFNIRMNLSYIKKILYR